MNDERDAERGEAAGDSDTPECYAVSGHSERVAGGGERVSAPFRAEQYDALRRLINQAEQAEGRRFSLAGLFLLVTAMSALLAIGSRLPRSLFAGLAGLATLLSMVVLSLVHAPSLLVQVGWWMLLLIYLLAIGWAIWG